MQNIFNYKYVFLFLFMSSELPGQVNEYLGINRNDNTDFIHISYNNDNIDVNISFDKLKYDISKNDNDIVNCTVESFSLNNIVGELSLPKKTVKLQIPDNVTVNSLDFKITGCITKQELENIKINFVEAYRKSDSSLLKKIPDGGSKGEDYEVFRYSSFFPSQPVIRSNPYRMNGRNFIDLELWPFQYKHNGGILNKVERISFRIEFKADGGKPEYTGFEIKPASPDKTAIAPAKMKINDSYAGYVIISTNDVLLHSDNIDTFISHIEHDGYNVITITEDDYGILNGPFPDERADKIRQWLINNYETLNIEYVLLIGNPDPDDPLDPLDEVGDIPMKMLYPRVGNSYYWSDYESPSDYYYSDLDGNWDLDGDGLYGEARAVDEPTSPDPGIDENTFSIRWTGRINVTDTSGMRIAAYYDDGTRIWVDSLDEEPVIDDWGDHIAGTSFYDILTPGLHDIKIEFYQNNSNAFFKLLYGSVGANWYSTVTGSMLYYWDGENYVEGGLNGYYFNDTELTEPVFSRKDPVDIYSSFSFRWFSGDNGTGGVDFTPEVCLGRIPVYDDDYITLDNILSKIIDYKTTGKVCWRNNILLPMKPLDTSTPNYQLGETIIDSLCNDGKFDYHRVYDEDYGLEPPPETIPCSWENVLSAWTNKPFGLVTWATHGSVNTAESIMNTYYATLLNDDYPSIVFQGSCNNGYPEFNWNLAYTLLMNGAVSTVSASRVSWYPIGFDKVYPDRLYIQDMAYLFTENVVKELSVGKSLSNIKNVSSLTSNDMTWMNIFDFNLYGEPSLILNVIGENGLPKICSEEYISICEGSEYLGWTESGIYIRNLTSSSGCDSIVTTNLTVNPDFNIDENISICEGNNYLGWTESGIYVRNLISSSGCDSIMTTNLTVNEKPPAPQVTRNNDTLVSNTANGNQWYLDDFEIEGAVSQEYIVKQSGNYYCIITNSAGCTSDQSNILYVFYTSLKELNNKNIRVSPNPTTGVIIIEGLPDCKPVDVRIYDMNGKFIKSKVSSSSSVHLDLSNELSDVYLIIVSEQYKKIIKIIKE